MGWPNPQKGRVKPALLQPRAGMGMLRCRGVVSGELLQQALSHPFRLAPCKRSPPSSRHLFFWGHLGTAAVSGRGAAEAVPGQPGCFAFPSLCPGVLDGNGWSGVPISGHERGWVSSSASGRCPASVLSSSLAPTLLLLGAGSASPPCSSPQSFSRPSWAIFLPWALLWGLAAMQGGLRGC